MCNFAILSLIVIIQVFFFLFLFFWQSFVQLLKIIQFVSWDFSFIDISRSSRVQFRNSVVDSYHTGVFLPIFALLAEFCATIKNYSVCLLRFLFRSHVQIFSCAISPVVCLKFPYSYFSSVFFPCFADFLKVLLLPLLLLATVINFSLYFLISSSSRCIDASTYSSILASSFPSSFLDTYFLPLLCNASYIVMNFLSFDYYFSLLRAFHNSVIRLFLTGV